MTPTRIKIAAVAIILSSATAFGATQTQTTWDKIIPSDMSFKASLNSQAGTSTKGNFQSESFNFFAMTPAIIGTTGNYTGKFEIPFAWYEAAEGESRFVGRPLIEVRSPASTKLASGNIATDWLFGVRLPIASSSGGIIGTSAETIEGWQIAPGIASKLQNGATLYSGNFKLVIEQETEFKLDGLNASLNRAPLFALDVGLDHSYEGTTYGARLHAMYGLNDTEYEIETELGGIDFISDTVERVNAEVSVSRELPSNVMGTAGFIFPIRKDDTLATFFSSIENPYQASENSFYVNLTRDF